MAVRSFRDLQVWQQAMELVTDIYRQTESFPDKEKYGLTSQLRRAAVSVPSNIAEGQGRRTTGEYLNQLSIARGSLLEVQTQIEIALRLNYLTPAVATTLTDRSTHTARLLNALINALERKLK